MMSASASASARNRSPFTTTQWQELEQQALVFKYMVTGAPIPPDLIYSIKRSLDSSMSTRLFPHHPIGWGCFEMGFGRKVDPEPGRCRRTDGKKWRCSKEAYPDSKYCERHMHRGRNRSRKPVEVVVSSSSSSASAAVVANRAAAAAATSNNNNTSSSSSSHQLIQPPPYNNNMNLSINNMPSASSFPFSPLPSSLVSEPQQHFSQPYQNSSSSSLSPFFYKQQLTPSGKPPDSDFPPHDAITHQLLMDSGSYSRDEKDYSRHIHGMREGVDERAFFPEASGSARSYPPHHDHSYQQLSINSYKSYSDPQHFQSINDNQRQQEEEEQQQQQQHCFVLGTDFKSNKPSKEKEGVTTQRPLHHFFGEWPPKNTDSWLDLASNSRIHSDE